MVSAGDELADTLKKIYGSGVATNAKVEQVKDLAIREWTKWLNADYRPDSITELNFDRTIQLNLLMTGKYPEIDDLTFNFNLAPGQAQYIASRMRYKNYPDLRKAAWTSILGKLNDAKKRLKKDQETVTLVLDDWEIKELQLVEKRRIPPDDEDYIPLARNVRHGGFAWTCNLSPNSMNKLIKVLEELLGK